MSSEFAVIVPTQSLHHCSRVREGHLDYTSDTHISNKLPYFKVPNPSSSPYLPPNTPVVPHTKFEDIHNPHQNTIADAQSSRPSCRGLQTVQRVCAFPVLDVIRWPPRGHWTRSPHPRCRPLVLPQRVRPREARPRSHDSHERLEQPANYPPL